MHISKIKIQNFRLFTDFDLTLNAGLNVVVGQNNSGKTALIDAIRLALDTNSAEWVRLVDTDFHNDENSFSIQIKFDSITAEQAAVFIEHLTHEKIDEDNRKSVLYVNLIAHRTDIIKRGNRYIRTELKSGQNAEGPQIERDIRDYLSATYLKPLRDAEAELSSGRGSRLAQIISSSSNFDRNSDSFKSLLEELIAASLKVKENNGLKMSKEEIDKNFKKLVFSSDDFPLAIQILGSKPFDEMSKAEKERAFQDILQRLSLVLDENSPKQGLGYNNALFMATELILLEQDKDEFPLLLIEEPEAHLHPQLQMKFLKFIRDEYSSDGKPKLQTILTTHSPNLASKSPLDSIIVMSEGSAFPMRQGDTALAKEDYVFLEKFLDVTKSNLFFAKGVLIVEGDGENILLPTIAKLLDRPLEDYGVSIVNVGSTAYARYAKIFLRSGEAPATLPVKVAVLRDLDLWPAKADEKDSKGVGFKEKKDGNSSYWWSEDAEKNKRNTLSDLEKQNVKVYVSDEWTFEYCLIRSGFAKDIFNIVKNESDKFGGLPSDEEEKAIKIFGMVANKSGGKTVVAYKLASVLERNFSGSGKKQALRTMLPAYLIEALEYLTGEFPENLDEGCANLEENGEAQSSGNEDE